MFRRIGFFYIRDIYIFYRRYIYILSKTDILMIKVMIKKLYCCFCTDTQYSFILNYRGVGESVGGVQDRRSFGDILLNINKM